MELTQIRLTDYRNYREQSLEFRPGINVLVGDNAQGKTNLLEAVRLCSIGRSHRTSRDRELIYEGAQQARVALAWRRRDGSHELIALIPSTSPKQLRADGKALRRSGELMGLIATVLFAPEDLALVKAGPGERRRFIDMELSQLRPVYYYALQRYNRALKQRNNLIRELDAQPALRATLDGWDDVLAREGAAIVAQRAKFVERLDEFARQRHQAISGGEQLRCEYASSVDPGDPERSMRQGLEQARARISFATYTGLRVDREALHVFEGQNMVYVKSGNMAYLRPVTVIFANDSYALLSDDYEKDVNEVKRYDTVIVRGDDLYDKKILS